MKRKETSTRFVFKLTAIIVSVMLLLITAHFMMIHSEAHVHAYSHMGPYVTNSSSAGFHRYVTGTVTDSNGSVTYLYGNCEMVNYYYTECDMCACGDIINVHNYVETHHMSCGQ